MKCLAVDCIITLSLNGSINNFNSYIIKDLKPERQINLVWDSSFNMSNGMESDILDLSLNNMGKVYNSHTLIHFNLKLYSIIESWYPFQTYEEALLEDFGDYPLHNNLDSKSYINKCKKVDKPLEIMAHPLFEAYKNYCTWYNII